jgi:hypothetical protein
MGERLRGQQASEQRNGEFSDAAHGLLRLFARAASTLRRPVSASIRSDIGWTLSEGRNGKQEWDGQCGRVDQAIHGAIFLG